MIKHIVMWRVAGETQQEKAQSAARVKEAFEALAGKVPGLLAVEVGANISPAAEAFDVVLYTEFVDRDALKGYASHPEHLAVRDALTGVRLSRTEVDYEVLGNSR